MGRKSAARSQRRQRPAGQGDGKPARPSTRARRWTHLAVPRSVATAGAAVALALAVAVVWATPRAAGDTFMALAGGRDVLDGKLGKPDEWSFTTKGRVWPHQNWGFDAVAAGARRVAGDPGLVALKGVALLAIAAAAVLAARSRGSGWPLALVVTAGALAGARWHFELRANLATYLLALLVVLIVYESRTSPARIWLAVPVLAVWANAHGGFMLGFALLGLWTASSGVAAARGGGWRAALHRIAHPCGALAAAVMAAAALSPFGITNLTHPFTIAREEEWRTISEWRPPSLTATSGPDTVWELAILLAVAVTAAVVTAVRVRGRDASSRAGTAAEIVLFDAGLVVLMAAMALSASRFVPLALLLLAPVAAAQADRALGDARAGAAIAAAAALVVAGVPFGRWVVARYSSENPRFTDETFFERMVGADRMPFGAADFLADNAVTGRAYNEWRWEGFLRLRCPRLKLFLGGRAQQIYDAEALEAYTSVSRADRPESVLAAWDVHLAVVPLEGAYAATADRLVYSPGARWAVVYYDGRAAVLADSQAAATHDLVAKVAAGSAVFRNRDVAALSGAICRLSPAVGRADRGALDDLVAANRALPTSRGPWFLFYDARELNVPPTWLVTVLQGEDARLAGEAGRGRGRLRALQERASADQVLSALYGAAGRTEDAARWAATTAEAAARLQSVLDGS
ncbi:MAG TPA: hypothetical protein VMT19_02995 [Thermoanaerobaculaceae bacterium]|nr:hypothetical protein [Thermoanaerobaculaceae bacterium]